MNRILLIFILLFVSSYSYSQSKEETSKGGYIYSLPSSDKANKNIFCLKGEKVKILDKLPLNDNFVQVRYAHDHGSVVGYMLIKDIAVTDEYLTINYNSEDITTDNITINTKINLPPILTITSVDFSENVLDGNEVAQLTLTIKNSGPGDARNVYVNLTGNLSGLKFPFKSTFPTIKANGGEETITIDITGGIELPTAEASIKMEVIEPISKVKIQGKQLNFPTREFLKPDLILAQYNLIENQSANPNKQIDINELVDFKFAVQNIGLGNAEDVIINIKNNQKGVVLLGMVFNDKLKQQNPNFSQIQSGKFETMVYRYFVNSDFNDNELKFTIISKEKNGKFGFTVTKSFPINKQLNEVGYIRRIAEADNGRNSYREVRIEDIPDFVVDVDTNIPETTTKQIHTYALIIGNEDYQSKQKGLTVEQNVDFAINDAQVFALYCKKTLGIPNEQIKILKNATSGQISQGLAWINNLSKIERGNAKLIFYYSGHGLPDEKTKEPYLIPVDISGTNLRYGVKIANVYEMLTEHPSKQVAVFLDACFSGGARNQGLLAMKGIKVKPKKDNIKGNMVVFSSSSGNESSAVYREKQHGYFTYYLLKKLKESSGEIDFNELNNYIINSVSKRAGLNGKIQTPEINVSLEVEDKWKVWKLK